MGAGASTLPERIDKETARRYAGDQFDEARFDAAATDGAVSREAFTAALSKPEDAVKIASLEAALSTPT